MKKFIETFSALITGAFSLLAALAWNEAIKAFVQKYISPGEGFRSMFVYAVMVTLVAVFAAIYLNKIAKKLISREERMEKELIKLKEEKKNK